MAEAMARVLAWMKCTAAAQKIAQEYSGSERGWSVPRRKGKVPIVKHDAENMAMIYHNVTGMGTRMPILGSWDMWACDCRQSRIIA